MHRQTRQTRGGVAEFLILEAMKAEFVTDVLVTMTKRVKFVTDEYNVDSSFGSTEEEVEAKDDAYEHSAISIEDCLEELKKYIKKECGHSTTRRTYLMNLLEAIEGWNIETENTTPEFTDWA